MSKVNFFSNSLIVLSGKECRTTSSLSNSRRDTSFVFEVPEHTIGTKNLLVFLNGKLQIPERDYVDSNSYQVKFAKSVATNVDFYSILVATNDEIGESQHGILLLSNEF